ncbi:MAG TPA: 30S ribosomal protein S6 [Candidatus Dormibacteraeota bacterium]
MSRDYEILFIVRPELDEEQVNASVKSVEDLIRNLGGEVQRTDLWGRRRLAYEVSHLREGHYVLVEFELESDRIEDLKNSLKISETVFRFLVTRRPEKASRAAEPPSRARTERAPEPQAVAGPEATAEPETASVGAEEET